MLKNSQALDNIRNTQAGHIQIDYRNCCAMLNFNFKPCITDGEKAVTIARRIRIRSGIKKNALESLLKMRFTSSVSKIDVKDVDDFPKITPQVMIEKITLGSFKVRQCLSYMKQMIQNSKVYHLTGMEKHITDSQVLNDLQQHHHKILAVEMTSRHKRGKKTKISTKKPIDPLDTKNFRTNYKVFVQYNPVNTTTALENNGSNAIKRYICSCMSGRIVAGCCVHVATLIYFLGYAKEKIDCNSLKLPGEHLTSILVKINSSEPSNSPRYVKAKRSFKQRAYEISHISSNNTTDSEPETALENQIEKAVEKENQLSIKKEAVSLSIELHESPNNYIPYFIEHIPKWGGYIYNGNKKIKITNTCTIDNYLFALWVLSKTIMNFQDRLDPQQDNTMKLKEIINNIDSYNWSRSREIWAFEIMKVKTDDSNQIDFFGTIEDKFTKYLNQYQKHELRQKCSRECIFDGNVIISDSSMLIYLEKIINNAVIVSSKYSARCEKCKQRVTCDIVFQKTPLFLFVEPHGTVIDGFLINDMPRRLNIANHTYQFLCATLFINGNHFVSVFELNGKLFLVDDLKQTATLLIPPKSLRRSKRQKNDSIDYFSIHTRSALYYLI